MRHQSYDRTGAITGETFREFRVDRGQCPNVDGSQRICKHVERKYVFPKSTEVIQKLIRRRDRNGCFGRREICSSVGDFKRNSGRWTTPAPRGEEKRALLCCD